MPATANKLVWENMRDKLKAMGGATNAVIGEPSTAMQSGLVSIIPESGQIDETVLNAAREKHVVTLRRYENALQEPAELIESKLDAWRAEIQEDLFGDFDLGGTMGYLLPTEMPWAYGYEI